MPEKVSEPKLPRGLSRLAFRFPISLYHAHLGGLMGYRFVLLTHTGRKSGQLRQNVLEVVRYDKATGGCIVASGWGAKSDWFRNVTANPHIFFQIRGKRSAGIAERLSPDDAGRELLDYARRHPFALRELADFMGYKLTGNETEDDVVAIGRTLPMFAFKPAPES